MPIFWTPKQVAERLQVSIYTISRWARQGKLPVTRIGNRLRFDPQAIEEALAAGAVGSMR